MAARLLTKATAHRRIKGVCPKVWVHMKVKIKKAKVELPIEPDRMAPIFMDGTKAQAKMQSMDGQSIEMVIHKISTPINIDRKSVV